MGPQSRYNTHKALEKAHKEEVKLDYESFYRVKKMLSSNDEEDQAVALETLYNMKNNEVILTLLAKSLAHGGRYTLLNDKRFNNDFLAKGNDLEWQTLFPILKKKLKPSMILEKKIMSELVINLIKDHLLYDNFHNIIKDIKIELNYE
jgi:hypothetical protein